jgi:hypothetical protein
MNHKKLYRLYREEKLSLGRRKRAVGTRTPMMLPTTTNQRCSLRHGHTQRRTAPTQCRLSKRTCAHSGRAPHLLAADRSFWLAANQRAAQQAGVEKVCIPALDRLRLNKRPSNGSAGFAAVNAAGGLRRTHQRAQAP